ncbi:MAG: DUF885 domain-containing protein [Planctomycetota bacterium]|jgi:uncharacterized protein (DUF885 family)
MIRKALVLIVTVIALMFLQGCADTASQQMEQLFEDAWQFRLRENPLFATHYGDHRFDDKLSAVSVADEKRRYLQHKLFLKRLNSINRNALTPAQQLNYDIFKRLRQNIITDYDFSMYLMPITHMGGFHTHFPELPKQLRFEKTKDYENYIARLNAFGRWTDEHIALMRTGIKNGHVLPKIVAKEIPSSLKPHIVEDADKSLFFEPLENFPKTISSQDRTRLTNAARIAITNSIVPAYKRLLDFTENQYIHSSRESISASALPNGRAYYEYCIEYYTTTNLTPQQIHETGLTEVERIKTEMFGIINKLSFEGDFNDFANFLRTDKRFYADTPQELLKQAAYIAKIVDGRLPNLFGKLPRMPFGLEQVPDYIAAETTGAYYMRPAGDGTRSGFYYINTHDLHTRPLYLMTALSLHEAMPGHHLQIALQQELTDLPKFRRFTWFTAFGEGWALYAEQLGLEMDLYEDPYDNFGRLVMEMWRACRLVVDTGIHYKDWSRQKAIDYMIANTAMPEDNITTEIDRYIVWPGQALAYKIGELKIRQLRNMAEQKLGENFNVRSFHDHLLANGPVPLDVLENKVNTWIDDQNNKRIAN